MNLTDDILLEIYELEIVPLVLELLNDSPYTSTMHAAVFFQKISARKIILEKLNPDDVLKFVRCMK